MSLTFERGGICVFEGSVCEILSVERVFTGRNAFSRAFVGIPDGTELPPTLTLVYLYGPDGEPAEDPRETEVSSRFVSDAGDPDSLEREIKRLQKRIDILRKLQKR